MRTLRSAADFSKKGLIIALFKLSGIIQDVKDSFIMNSKSSMISDKHIFDKLVGIGSSSHDLVFMDDIIVVRDSAVTGENSVNEKSRS